MAFTLTSDGSFVTWDDDQVDGFPTVAVDDAQSALADANDRVGATPTGPFFDRGTPEHAFIVLRRVWPGSDAEGGPYLASQGDELDVPEQVREGLFEEAEHPRGRGGKWVDHLGREREIAKDTPQQVAILRQNRTARAVRREWPPGTRVVGIGGAKAERGTLHGTVARHVPGTNAQGGYLSVEWDNGSVGRHSPISLAKDEPVDVHGDVALAAKLLGEGRRVQLSQPREVSTLLDKLSEIVAEANAKGDAAPMFDLCKVSVKGTNLFCAQSKGIPRVEMPQLKGEPVPGSKADALPKNEKGRVDLATEFVQHLRSLGVMVEDGKEQASYLRASQHELNGANVARITKEIEAGRPMSPIFVSRDDYIVDGHHGWAAQVGADSRDGTFDLELPIQRIDMPIADVLDEARRFAADWGVAPQHSALS